MSRVTVCLALVLCVGLTACVRGSGSDLTPGNEAPSFTLSSLRSHNTGKQTTGKQDTSLADFKGQVVVLNFWASWCLPCIEELPDLEKLYRDLHDKDVTVVSVALDEDPQEIEKIAESLQITFPILLDPTGVVKRLYKVQGFPETFVLDKDGAFVLFSDPDTGLPELRIIGPRKWSDAAVKAQLLRLAKR